MCAEDDCAADAPALAEAEEAARLSAAQMRKDLLAKIDQFCAKTGAPPTRFGAVLLNDTSFVSNLRRGLDLRLSTYTKLTKWLTNPRRRHWLAIMLREGEKNGPLDQRAGRGGKKHARGRRQP
jgi:hypothetical protein